MPVSVLLADDHQILRAGLKSLLEADGRFVVIAEANNGHETVSQVKKHRPDLVVMDVAMPDLNGVDATRKIKQLIPSIAVLALSGHSDSIYIKGMLEAGASGYLLKDVASEELVVALQTVAKGKLYVSPSVTDTLVEDYLNRVKGKVSADQAILSNREREVLQLVAEGLSTGQIAGKLHLSDRTIETHRKRIMDKLNLRSIAELTKYAIRAGITTLDS